MIAFPLAIRPADVVTLLPFWYQVSGLNTEKYGSSVDLPPKQGNCTLALGASLVIRNHPTAIEFRRVLPFDARDERVLAIEEFRELYEQWGDLWCKLSPTISSLGKPEEWHSIKAKLDKYL